MSRSAARVRTLASTDARLIGRDRFLAGGVAYILVMALVLRFVLPAVEAATLESSGFELSPYFPLITSYVAVITGTLLGGMVFGFTLLESREDGTLDALLVTSLPLSTFKAYRVAAPAILAAILVPSIALLIGVGLPPLSALIPISAVAAVWGAIWAFFVATCADNKVQAFAMLKIVGSTGLIAIGAYFVDEPLQYLAGVYPPYWLAKAYWVAEAGGSGWWVHLGIGAVLSLAVLAVLLRRFDRVAFR